MSRVRFSNTLALPEKQRQAARLSFSSYLRKNGIETQTLPGGQVFAVLDRDRVVGGVWIRTWPGSPDVGDIHIAASRYRFTHYSTVFAFQAFIMERAKIMGLRRWRVVISQESRNVHTALLYLGFREITRQSFPGIGDAVILEREVI